MIQTGCVRMLMRVKVSPHAEVVTLLQLSNRKPDAKIRIDINLEDYYRIKDSK